MTYPSMGQRSEGEGEQKKKKVNIELLYFGGGVCGAVFILFYFLRSIFCFLRLS